MQEILESVAIHYRKDSFPPVELDLKRLMPLVGPANAALARYDGILAGVPDPQILIAPLTTREAVLSSRIEGTQATVAEVLGYEVGELPDNSERREDVLEVVNYRKALSHAISQLSELPISSRMLRSVHGVLMQGVRGENRSPGEFRRIQNWIGSAGAGLENARFIPATPEELPACISRWEGYVHSEDVPDVLIQLAVLHAEFEAIHPFLDGNGRLGRLLIPLFLFSRDLLAAPCFYLSSQLESRRTEYYDRMLAVSESDDWTGWCEFFLDSIIKQANRDCDRVRAILELNQRMKTEIPDLLNTRHVMAITDFIFSKPVFRSADMADSTAISAATVKRFINVLTEAGILIVKRPAKGRTPAMLQFDELVRLVENP